MIIIYQKLPTQLLKEAGNEAVAILNHNIPSAYLIPAELYAQMVDIVDDYHLSKIVKERLNYDEKDLIEVSIDDL
jgi:antitoxin StbD